MRLLIILLLVSILVLMWRRDTRKAKVCQPISEPQPEENDQVDIQEVLDTAREVVDAVEDARGVYDDARGFVEAISRAESGIEYDIEVVEFVQDPNMRRYSSLRGVLIAAPGYTFRPQADEAATTIENLRGIRLSRKCSVDGIEVYKDPGIPWERPNECTSLHGEILYHFSRIFGTAIDERAVVRRIMAP